MIIDKPNILIVCGRNKRRSRTAEYIFKNDSRFNIRSAGLSEKSERLLSEKDVVWSDLIFAMEDKQKARIRELFRDINLPPIEVLHISDDYEYQDQVLIELLEEKINSFLMEIFKI
jgi:protein-tyrosine phosphatase